MERSKVYFTDMRVEVGTSILTKLQKLIKAAGINTIDMENRFVAIKIHFGEPGNISFLRPNFARAVVDVIFVVCASPFVNLVGKRLRHGDDRFPANGALYSRVDYRLLVVGVHALLRKLDE